MLRRSLLNSLKQVWPIMHHIIYISCLLQYGRPLRKENAAQDVEVCFQKQGIPSIFFSRTVLEITFFLHITFTYILRFDNVAEVSLQFLFMFLHCWRTFYTLLDDRQNKNRSLSFRNRYLLWPTLPNLWDASSGGPLKPFLPGVHPSLSPGNTVGSSVHIKGRVWQTSRNSALSPSSFWATN